MQDPDGPLKFRMSGDKGGLYRFIHFSLYTFPPIALARHAAETSTPLANLPKTPMQ